MLKLTCLLVICAIAAEGLPSQQRIIGGSLTTVNQYPFAAAILKREFSAKHEQVCGGTIINNRSVLSAGHCFWFGTIDDYRIRVGSSFSNSGGFEHDVSQIIQHPSQNLDGDIAVVRVRNAFNFGNTVQPGRIAGSNYNLGDNQPVWVIGWGFIANGGPPSEQLRHVQILTVNQNTCGSNVSQNFLCAGYLNVGGRGACNRDSGGPLLHHGVVVGTVIGGTRCGSPIFPEIYARVSRFSSWIQSNA